MEAKGKQKDSGSTLLIIILMMVLVGGGVGTWLLLKPKEVEETAEEKPTELKDTYEIGGNKNYELDDTEQIAGGISDPTKSNLFTPGEENKQLYLYGSEAQQLITELAKRLAQSNEVMGKLRKQYNIGQVFLGSGYTSDAQGAIDWMFYDNFSEVTQRSPSTYPIFSTWETQNRGKEIRDQLQVVVDTDWSRMGLSTKRVGGEPWYITALDLNLFYGKRGVHTHTADQINWNQADQGGLDMYKKINGHDVSNYRLIEHNANWRESFPAGNVHKIARNWVAEIDKLDKAVMTEAQDRLEKEGWVFTLTDNQTNV